MKRRFYVVFKGRTPGIYETWEECNAQVRGFSGCRHKSFTVYEDAMLAWNQHKASAIGRVAAETVGTRIVRALTSTTTMDNGTCVATLREPTVIGDNGVQDGNEERVFPDADRFFASVIKDELEDCFTVCS
ncbi:uncharacterized protein LOC131226001 [Magnolia sinica]|uniref:uncharacterized protein LOC131226001 n=1 Tax=Magnolia sinica TaxID=86752 RepID=UPI00265904AB|nr:uncharacterized protein LOC131226001 [Magnolia sinica]